MTTTISGCDLRIGDTIEVWWTPRRDTVMSIEPYRGPLAGQGRPFANGARIARFARLTTGMTVANDDRLELIARA